MKHPLYLQVFTLPSASLSCVLHRILKNEWQVTAYRTLHSFGTQFHSFLLAPAARIHFFPQFYDTKVAQIKGVCKLQSFITLCSHFCSLILHR